ncbi:AzlC family ABC transporter permease [Neisseriaceae bacterium ESL0693]|nr:AzlC family ABC transporter permease [Neisseriaceae bacterium ESL0693]
MDSALPRAKSGTYQAFKNGFIACMPTILGYWCIGFACGAIGIISGFSLTAEMALTVLLYAGGAHFLFYSLWLAGAETLAIVSGVFLINIRYVLMSSYLAGFCQGSPLWQRFIHGSLLTDETFGVAVQHARTEGKLEFWWLFGLNLSAYLNWIIANLMGCLFAKLIPVTLSQGLMFSLTAMFIGLLTLNYFSSQYKKYEIMAIILAALLFWLALTLFSANISLLLATIIATSITTYFFMLRARENRL